MVHNGDDSVAEKFLVSHTEVGAGMSAKASVSSKLFGSSSNCRALPGS